MTLNQNDGLTMSVHAHSGFFKVLGGAGGAGGAGGVEMGEEWGEWSPIAQNRTKGKSCRFVHF